MLIGDIFSGKSAYSILSTSKYKSSLYSGKHVPTRPHSVAGLYFVTETASGNLQRGPSWKEARSGDKEPGLGDQDSVIRTR